MSDDIAFKIQLSLILPKPIKGLDGMYSLKRLSEA